MPLRLLRHDLLKSQIQVTNLSAVPKTAPEEPDVRLLPEPDYFETIDQLIAWKADVPGTAQAPVDVIVSQTEKLGSTPRDVSKLLVCHDFKGGYTENPFERGYSFEFWHLIDTFIYFSHKRITLPPRGWVDAGHRHGSKVLGTVIFEWAESKPDLQKCLYGSVANAPPSSLEPDNESFTFSTICISQLIRLAQDRNFDGYLINIETDLNFLPSTLCYPGKSQKEREEDAASMERESNFAGLEALVSSSVQHKRKERMANNANALSRWVGWLREEGRRLVGPHWEVIWYDSVTAAGQLRWQDALTDANAIFFEKSDAIFTNYTWARPPDPVPPGGPPEEPQPLFKHHPALLKSALKAKSMDRSPAEVYMGIDVFGRNCYGGYEIGRSLDLIFPSRNREHTKEFNGSSSLTDAPDDCEDLGLSVALFAPGWTWERGKEGGGERSWSEWWMDELRFWFGKATTTPESPDEVPSFTRYFGPRARHLPASLSSPSSSKPNSSLELTDLSISDRILDAQPKHSRAGEQRTGQPNFYTNFNRGSGCSWWVYGRKVYDALSFSPDPLGKLGWTDIGSSFVKPDRIWPRLVPLHFDEQVTTVTPKSICKLHRSPHGTWMVDRAGLIDNEVWQGGSSLEIVFRSQQIPSPEELTQEAPLTLLPLCTLNACHIASPPLTLSLEVIVKLFPNLTGSLHIRDMQLALYVIWATDEVSEECSYYIPLPPIGSTTFRELTNGWYSSKATLHINDVDLMQLAKVEAVVPVVALGIHLPLSPPLGDLRLLVGEISLSAHPPSQLVPTTVSPFSSSAITVTASSPGNLRWKRVSGPSAASPTSLWGILTWDDDEDCTRQGENGITSGLSSSYFNVFAFVPKNTRTSEGELVSGPKEQYNMWLGTSTYQHNPNSFVVAGLEPSALIPRDNGSAEQLASITFGVYKVGVSGGAKNNDAEGEEPWKCVNGMQELEVSLLL